MQSPQMKQLAKQLRKGLSPARLGAYELAVGQQRTAYRVGNFIIKENTGPYYSDAIKVTAYNRPTSNILAQWAKHRCRYAYEVLAGDWIVQVYTAPLGEKRKLQQYCARYDAVINIGDAYFYDLHSKNIGIDRTTDWLVVFDF
jgi:hypothetical protein